MSDYLQVCTTVGSEQEAQRVATAIVQRRLGACVQILGPITSVYRWEGKIETSQEWQCVIKTHLPRYAELESTLTELHSYEVPEIIATPIMTGSAAYLKWIDQETSEKA